jgi:hypothetical protein
MSTEGGSALVVLRDGAELAASASTRKSKGRRGGDGGKHERGEEPVAGRTDGTVQAVLDKLPCRHPSAKVEGGGEEQSRLMGRNQ